MNESASPTDESVEIEPERRDSIKDPDVPPTEQSPSIAPSVQAAWIVLGAVGFIGHAYSGKNPNFFHPLSDSTTLAWAVFLAVGLVLNKVRDIKIAGSSLSFREEAKAAVTAVVSSEKYKEAISSYSSLLQSWVNSASFFSYRLQAPNLTPDAVDKIVTRFCLERMEEARDAMRIGSETIRTSIWWYFEKEMKLRMILSKDISDDETWNKTYGLGDGLLGEAFLDNRMYNLANAPRSIYFEPTVGRTPTYKGLLITPIRIANKYTAGMLCIDRTTAEEFSADNENVAWALADLIGFAYTHPTARQTLAILPSDV